MTNEELEHGSFEIENRIRNLMWTISGDYDLDTKPDVTSSNIRNCQTVKRRAA